MSRPQVLEIYIARHGNTDVPADIIHGRRPEEPLTELGHQQGRELGQGLQLAGIMPDIVYSSPAVRTQETYQECSSAMDYPLPVPILDEDLHEIDQGSATGMDREKFYNELQMKRIQRDPRGFKAAPDAESVTMIESRILRFLGNAARDLQQQRATTALAFGHQFTTAVGAGALLGMSVAEIRDIEIPNCGLTLFEYDHGIWRNVYVGKRILIPTLIPSGLK